MPDKKVILVTGVAGYWGSRLAARLASAENQHVIGLDARQPAKGIENLDFVLADVRNPLLVELLRAEEVDTVCHLAFSRSTQRSESAFEANVIGTAKLLGACAEAGVRKIVLKSSTAVYGARPTNSAFLAEDQPLRGSRRYGYTRDRVEIETYCNGFRRRMPDLLLTLHRFPSIVGPTADTPMTRFLRTPWAPSMLGFDPMMQIIHEDDALAALLHAVLQDTPGVFNVAAEEALPLSKIRGMVGKLPFSVYHSCAKWGDTLLGAAGLRIHRFLPIEPDYLRYPWVGDLRRMRQTLGFAPRYTAAETLREFAAHLRLGRYRSGSSSLAQDSEQLQDIIDRRRRDRERQTRPYPDPAAGDPSSSGRDKNE